MPKEKVVVLGAGPTGLTAAAEILPKGYEVTLLEANSFVGGLSGSVLMDGKYFLDFGPHLFYTENLEALEYTRQLMGKDFIEKDRKVLLYFLEKYISYPLSPKNLPELGFNTTVKGLSSYFFTQFKKVFRKPDESTFEGWAKSNFGNYMYEIFFGPYTEQFWGEKCSNLSSMWADKRVANITFWKAVKAILSSTKGKENTKLASLIERDTLPVYYPRKGYGMISERLAERVKKRGGKILLNSRVEKVEKQKKGYKVSYLSSNKKKTINADKIVSTIPMNVFALTFSPSLPEKITEAAKKLKSRGIVVLYLITEKQDILKNCQYIYYLGRGYHRISEMNKFSPETSPEGENMLCVEWCANKGDKLWKKTDSELLEMALPFLEKDEVIKRNEIKKYFVLKAPSVYPIFYLDYHENFKTVLDYLEKELSGIVFKGRQGTFEYIDTDHAILQGIDAAKKISGDLK